MRLADPYARWLLTAAVTLAVMLVAAPLAHGAVFSVTTDEDQDGSAADCPPNAQAPGCSLREAVTAANANAGSDSIDVPAGTYRLGSELVLAGDPVVISGAGRDATFIDGQDATRILRAQASTTVRQLTIQNGRNSQGDGGAVFAPGPSFTLEDAAVRSSTVFAGPSASRSRGAGIYALNDLTITRSFVTGNVATATAPTVSPWGGGVAVIGTGATKLTVTESTISENRAVSGNQLPAEGGGVYASKVEATITDSVVAQNNAGGDVGHGNGGGILSLAPLTLERTTVSDNHAGTAAGARGSGGGIQATGRVDVISSTINGNSTGDAFGRGGGVNAAAVPLTVKDSTLSGNIARGNGTDGAAGGAIYAQHSSGDVSVTVEGSTLSSNRAVGSPNGPAVGGGADVPDTGTVTVENSTVSGNTAEAGGNLAAGGGISSANASVEFRNATLHANAASGLFSAGGNAAVSNKSAESTIFSGGSADPGTENCSGGPVNGGHNLDSGSSCGLSTAPGSGNLINTDPKLGSLLPNGGPTRTHALAADSPAVDGGANCPADDQRGVSRPQGPFCDIGAYELTRSGDLAVIKVDDPDPARVGAPLTWTITVTSSGPAGDATQATVTDALPEGVDLVSAVPSQGSCSGASTVVCDLGTVATGQSATVAITVTPRSAGTLSNTASVTGPRPDSNAANDSATAVTRVDPAPGDAAAVDVAPRFTSFPRVVPRVFEARQQRGPSILRRAAVGTRVRYGLSEPARVTFTVERAAKGRRRGRRCERPSPRNRRGPKCTRYVRQRGSFVHVGAIGANSFGFTGRLRKRPLKPARYRLVARAADAAGNTSAASRATFRINPPRRR